MFFKRISVIIFSLGLFCIVRSAHLHGKDEGSKGNKSKEDPQIKCPADNTERGEYFRYDQQRKKCFQLERREPCGENMSFYDLDGINGICDCLHYEQRTLIFHPQSNKCHHIYDQGCCKSGEWITMNEKGQPMCEMRKCEENKYVYKNSCVPIGAKEDCEGNTTIGFVKGSRDPTCVGFVVEGVAFKPPQTQCSPGSALAVSGKCELQSQF